MAKRKYEFRPDKPNSGLLNKLYLTKKQRLSLLKWLLYSGFLLVLSILQDVILCRVDIFGATTDLLPCAIFLICVYQGTETGSVFALVAACMYQFSGTAPGYYVIVLITTLALVATMFRQSYLRKSLSSDLLCAGTVLVLYELLLFGITAVMGLVSAQRLPTFLVTAVLSLVAMPVFYPIILSIEKIGGETWKE